MVISLGTCLDWAADRLARVDQGTDTRVGCAHRAASSTAGRRSWTTTRSRRPVPPAVTSVTDSQATAIPVSPMLLAAVAQSPTATKPVTAATIVPSSIRPVVRQIARYNLITTSGTAASAVIRNGVAPLAAYGWPSSERTNDPIASSATVAAPASATPTRSASLTWRASSEVAPADAANRLRPKAHGIVYAASDI